MRLNQNSAETVIPHGLPENEALERTTHLAIGAHADDLEIMACHGILACFQQPDKWFAGVIVTDGAGSPRAGDYQSCTDDEMVEIRKTEQRTAATLGGYTAQFLLDYPSSAIKDPGNKSPIDDLQNIIEATKPSVIYTHNLADRHDTHVGVALRAIEAIRNLPPEVRPKQVLGCEVWGSLDWLPDTDKVALDLSQRENLQAALLGVFDSQITGGKRYDLATLGRRRSNATYHQSHAIDETTGITFAMDLTPLVQDGAADPLHYTHEQLIRFTTEISARIQKIQGSSQ